jgi:hypothetical protein
VQEIGRGLQRQVRAHARHHDRRADRLGDVVHRAQRQATGLVLDLGHRGEEDHRDALGLRVALQPLGILRSVHLRHHDVEQDQVRRALRNRDLQGALAAVGDLDAIFVLEQAAHQHQVVGRVVHHQHGGSFRARVHGRYSSLS